MNHELKNRLDTWFAAHRQEIINDIMALVAIPSVAAGPSSGAPYGAGCKQALLSYLDIAQRLGFSTRNYEDHVGAAWLEEKGKTIGLWGHLDVVPDGEGWDFEPFHPVYREGFIIGRGADDNKGPSVGMLYVLLCLKELGINTACGLKAFAGCQEEAGMEDISYYLENYAPPDMSIIPDCGFPVCYGEKGIIEAKIVSRQSVSPDILSLSGGTASNVVPATAQITLRVRPGFLDGIKRLPESIRVERLPDALRVSAFGKPCHAAFPQGGINAIHELMKALLEAEMLEGSDRDIVAFMRSVNDDVYGSALGIRLRDEESGDLSCVGSLLSMVDGRLCLGLNIRYCVSAKGGEILGRMKERCEDNQCELICLRDSAPGYFPKEHPVVGRLTDIYNACTGAKALPYVMAGGTYARKLPCAIGFGLGGLPRRQSPLLRPGHGSAHCPDEALDVDSYLQALTIFTLGLIEADKLMDASS